MSRRWWIRVQWSPWCFAWRSFELPEGGGILKPKMNMGTCNMDTPKKNTPTPFFHLFPRGLLFTSSMLNLRGVLCIWINCSDQKFLSFQGETRSNFKKARDLCTLYNCKLGQFDQPYLPVILGKCKGAMLHDVAFNLGRDTSEFPNDLRLTKTSGV